MLHNRREAGNGEKVVSTTEVQAARAESTEVVTKEDTRKDALAQVQAQVSLWQAQVFPKPPPRRVPCRQEEIGMHSVSPDDTLGETTADSAASDETLRAATNPDISFKTPDYDVSQWSTAGQDKTEHGGGCKVKTKADILDILKVKKEAGSSRVKKDMIGSTATAKQGCNPGGSDLPNHSTKHFGL